jgi:hypothetical protein
MATHPYGPQKSFTAQEVDAWLLAVAEKHAAIHHNAAHSGDGHSLYEAFTAMQSYS